MVGRLLIAASICGAGAAAAHAATPCTSGTEGVCDATLQFPTSSGTYTMPYYRNYPLGTPPAGIRRAVILIHGNGRQVWTDFGAVASAAIHDNAINDTIIVAPLFPKTAVGSMGLCWSDSPDVWKEGGAATCGPAMSSFEIIDEILDRLLDASKYPDLEMITFAGHSAGGQFVQRYALAGHGNYFEPAGVSYRYVVANPSSYAYLNGLRYYGGYLEQWKPPTVCPSGSQPNGPGLSKYNEWRYGLDDRPDIYVDDVGPEWLVAAYPSRDVIYLVGELDTRDHYTDPELDWSCPANLQGTNRNLRGFRFKAFMDHSYPGHIHLLWEVPGAHHVASEMYDSYYGKRALFH